MNRTLSFCLLLLATILLVSTLGPVKSSWAADSSQPAGAAWKHKPIAQWSDEDSKDVLSDSPWVKFASPQWLRDLSPDERRQSGDMEATEGHGVGWAIFLGLFNGSERTDAAIKRAHAKPPVDAVMIRWESALPIRTAEKKVGETGVPLGNGEYYAIAIYDIQTPKKFNLANELKDVAYIRRTNKKDFKPARVEILWQEDEKATIVYLFPRSVEISKRDGWLVFAAQIGRLFVTQNFFAGEMLLRDELEL
jgi:hypothetical protein